MMKRLFAFGAAFFVLTVVPVCAQAARVKQKSPAEVVRDFLKIETTGGRLTPEGWNKASAFFIRPQMPFGNKVIHVILNFNADVAYETARTENWAEVYGGTNEVGQLDSSLRFDPTLQPPNPYHVAFIVGPSIKFNLVLTDRHWQLESDGVMGKEVTGQPEWKIVDDLPGIFITVDAAVRYVTKMRAKTSDPVTRKNADSALAALKHLQHPVIKDRPSACACY
ncbi:MAG: hypothetical protein ACYDD2_01815 [Candidatus Acidiferrales bacterium]